MSERLKKTPVWHKVFGVIETLALAACATGERIGLVTPTPEGTSTNPTETVPPFGQTSETKIFAEMLIGEAGIGRVNSLVLNENPDSAYVAEVENRALETLRVEDPGLSPERIKVYAFEMQGEKGNAPFPLISVSDKVDPDKLLSVFAGFGVDASGVLVPPEGGKIAIFLRLTTVQSGDYVGIQDRKSPSAMCLPPLFEIDQALNKAYFFPPYADSLQKIVPVHAANAFLSLVPMPIRPVYYLP